ncbi:peptide chain release factor N(5)-glutamine methyltransferase [Candidatus Peregrinibacteria bacterium]|nr:peptide chain release factor N(5)-glutamine methyltransferase [Candidatus Peregrinibacteria bacterium]
MTIKVLVDFGHWELIAFDSARLDAELLLSHVLGKPVTYILAHDKTTVGWFQVWRFKRLVSKRKEGMPVAYLRGHREFYGLDFKVSRDVLVPRPDTEALVEAVIGYITSNDLLLDVGTGSGCIPIAVLKHVKGLEAVATDVSGAALRVARTNIKKYQLESRIQLVQSDLLEEVDPLLFEDRQLVVTANLPYVPRGFEVNIETKFEPQVALWGGQDGMDLYKKLLKQLLPLAPKAMFFECFDFQKAILAENAPGYELQHIKNRSGGAGVVILERSN